MWTVWTMWTMWTVWLRGAVAIRARRLVFEAPRPAKRAPGARSLRARPVVARSYRASPAEEQPQAPLPHHYRASPNTRCKIRASGNNHLTQWRDSMAD